MYLSIAIRRFYICNCLEYFKTSIQRSIQPAFEEIAMLPSRQSPRLNAVGHVRRSYANISKYTIKQNEPKNPTPSLSHDPEKGNKLTTEVTKRKTIVKFEKPITKPAVKTTATNQSTSKKVACSPSSLKDKKKEKCESMPKLQPVNRLPSKTKKSKTPSPVKSKNFSLVKIPPKAPNSITGTSKTNKDLLKRLSSNKIVAKATVRSKISKKKTTEIFKNDKSNIVKLLEKTGQSSNNTAEHNVIKTTVSKTRMPNFKVPDVPKEPTALKSSTDVVKEISANKIELVANDTSLNATTEEIKPDELSVADDISSNNDKATLQKPTCFAYPLIVHIKKLPPGDDDLPEIKPAAKSSNFTEHGSLENAEMPESSDKDNALVKMDISNSPEEVVHDNNADDLSNKKPTALQPSSDEEDPPVNDPELKEIDETTSKKNEAAIPVSERADSDISTPKKEDFGISVLKKDAPDTFAAQKHALEKNVSVVSTPPKKDDSDISTPEKDDSDISIPENGNFALLKTETAELNTVENMGIDNSNEVLKKPNNSINNLDMDLDKHVEKQENIKAICQTHDKNEEDIELEAENIKTDDNISNFKTDDISILVDTQKSLANLENVTNFSRKDATETDASDGDTSALVPNNEIDASAKTDDKLQQQTIENEIINTTNCDVIPNEIPENEQVTALAISNSLCASSASHDADCNNDEMVSINHLSFPKLSELCEKLKPFHTTKTVVADSVIEKPTLKTEHEVTERFFVDDLAIDKKILLDDNNTISKATHCQPTPIECLSQTADEVITEQGLKSDNVRTDDIKPALNIVNYDKKHVISQNIQDIPGEITLHDLQEVAEKMQTDNACISNYRETTLETEGSLLNKILSSEDQSNFSKDSNYSLKDVIVGQSIVETELTSIAINNNENIQSYPDVKITTSETLDSKVLSNDKSETIDSSEHNCTLNNVLTDHSYNKMKPKQESIILPPISNSTEETELKSMSTDKEIKEMVKNSTQLSSSELNPGTAVMLHATDNKSLEHKATAGNFSQEKKAKANNEGNFCSIICVFSVIVSFIAKFQDRQSAVV